MGEADRVPVAYSEVKDAFNTCFKLDFINALYTTVVVLVFLFFVYRILELYRKSVNDKKVLFDMIIEYGKYAMFIIAFPFILQFVELVGANAQDSIMSKFDKTIHDDTIMQNIFNIALESIEDLFEINSVTDVITIPVKIATTPLRAQFELITMGWNALFILLIKKTFFFFVAGRYLWLAMLKIVSPIAIACYIHKDTRQYFYTWVRYMLLNYLMIPVLLFTEIFSNNLIYTFFDEATMGGLGIAGLVSLFIVKISLFKIAMKRIDNLL